MFCLASSAQRCGPRARPLGEGPLLGPWGPLGYFRSYFEWMAISSGWLFRLDGIFEWIVLETISAARIWSYLVIFDDPSLYLMIFGVYLAIFGRIRPYLNVFCGIWSYLIVFGHIWSRILASRGPFNETFLGFWCFRGLFKQTYRGLELSGTLLTRPFRGF